MEPSAGDPTHSRHHLMLMRDPIKFIDDECICVVVQTMEPIQHSSSKHVLLVPFGAVCSNANLFVLATTLGSSSIAARAFPHQLVHLGKVNEPDVCDAHWIVICTESSSSGLANLACRASASQSQSLGQKSASISALAPEDHVCLLNAHNSVAAMLQVEVLP